MLTLYSYPELFGVADNNPFGLKVFAFLKLAGVAFRHEHIFDATAAPRGQLPYIVDDGEHVGDSDTIIAHVIAKYRLPIDSALTQAQRNTDLMVRRTLDDLYWVMSYSRWKDPQFWPLFRDAMLGAHASLTVDGMEAARKYNFERYRYQGIGRYEPQDVYTRGIADLVGRGQPDQRGRISYSARTRPASTRASTASSPTSISTTSTRRSSGSSRRIAIWSGIALQSTKR